MRFTRYFEERVRPERPEARREDWIEAAIMNPLDRFAQPDGRIRVWCYVEEVGKYLRVVLEPDGETVHNPFYDRTFARRMRRRQ